MYCATYPPHEGTVAKMKTKIKCFIGEHKRQPCV